MHISDQQTMNINFTHLFLHFIIWFVKNLSNRTIRKNANQSYSSTVSPSGGAVLVTLSLDNPQEKCQNVKVGGYWNMVTSM